MTREEAKELLPIIQAFAEGKTIQYCRDKYGILQWIDVPSDETVNFSDDTSKYRIKPEPKYRPFENVKECWQEMQKHKPFGWVKINGQYTNIIKLDWKDSSLLAGGLWYQICRDDVSKDNITFADDTPFGIREC